MCAGQGLGVRLQLARRRFTRPTAWAAAAAAGLILTFGGFIFYNTNVLNAYRTASERMERRAEYERRYGRYEGIPQPRLTGTNLHVEIYPELGKADIRGTYRLVNGSAVPIDAIHLATEVEPREVEFDRPATRVLEDEELGHRIYALEEPLQPGRSPSRRARCAGHGRRVGAATSTMSPMPPSGMSTPFSPPTTLCMKHSGMTLRLAQGRVSRSRSSIIRGMIRTWSAWSGAYGPR